MPMKEKRFQRIIKSVLIGTGLLSVPILIAAWIYFSWEKIPSKIHIQQGETEEFDFAIPATAQISKQDRAIGSLDLGKPVTFYASDTDTYNMSVKLFGFINFKETQVSVIDTTRLKPVGKPIGIYLKTKGILVIDNGEFEGEGGMMQQPSALLQAGDYICAYNGEEISLKKDLIGKINECNGEPVVLTIERGGEVFDIKVTPAKNKDGYYKLGIWVRDNAQGVGTMTYVTQAGEFGALGHGINDLDTATLMQLDYGSLYHADIVAIKKGLVGEPGEMTGYISYKKSEYLGDVEQNTTEGIYGSVKESFVADVDTEFLDIALKQDVHIGAVQIYCSINDDASYYNAEITDIYTQSNTPGRGFKLHITDESLIDETGGIVQGMSGSPIIQDGKIVGAVTHVLVNDPTRGYGIFIESMLDAAGK